LTGKIFWEIFKDTGDPICYLLYRASENFGQAFLQEKTAASGGGEPLQQNVGSDYPNAPY